MEFIDKIIDLTARMNSRSGRLTDYEYSKLSHIRSDDIARRSIECISIHESITAFYIKRDLRDSTRCGSGGQQNIKRIKDLRNESIEI